MLLFHADGRPFASGAADYFYQPATGDLTPRIILQVEIEGVLTSAIFDTGAPYLICSPELAPYTAQGHKLSFFQRQKSST